MGPMEPPQRRAPVSQYSRDQLDLLQTKFDELEAQGVFRRPEDLKDCGGIFEPILLSEVVASAWA